MVMTLYQSIPSFRPLIHFAPSEMGVSSSWKRVLYDLLGFRPSVGWAVITAGVKRIRNDVRNRGFRMAMVRVPPLNVSRSP